MSAAASRGRPTLGLAVLALVAGTLIARVDMRPTWDDTGVTAGALFMVAGLLAFLGLQPWVAAVLVGGPLVIAEWRGMNAAPLIAPVLALAGACAGALLRRATRLPRT